MLVTGSCQGGKGRSVDAVCNTAVDIHPIHCGIRIHRRVGTYREALTVADDMGKVRIQAGPFGRHRIFRTVRYIRIGRAADGAGFAGIAVGMVFPNLDILQSHIRQWMGSTSQIAEGEIPAADPIYGFVLVVRAADVVIVHGTQFYAIHVQIGHVGAVLRDAVFHAVGMGCSHVQITAGQRNAIIVVLAAVFAKGKQAAGVVSTEQEVHTCGTALFY